MVTDPVADMLARLENASRVQKASIAVPYTKHLHAIASKLSEAGYVGAIEEADSDPSKRALEIELLYDEDDSEREPSTPRITEVERVSKPSRRLYYQADEIPRVRYGYGTLFLSTPEGVLSDSEAREAHVGGEALFKVW